MSGVRTYSFREGDRSEYLAQFLLSAIGLCTAIPRQEDIGLDFLCSIADQEQDVLSFGYQFMVSVKSLSSPNIDLTVPEKRRDQKHVEWLFRQDTPLFLGVVDKNTVSIRLFSLLPLWFVFYEGGPVCGSISIKPRLDPTQTGDVGKPTRTPVPEWPRMFHFDVDVVHPIAVITLESIKDREQLRAAKGNLRAAARFARLNLVHHQLQIPHFYWFARGNPDGSAIQPAFYYLPVPKEKPRQLEIMKQLAHSLISIAMHDKETANHERLGAIRVLLRDIPPEFFPEEVRLHLPEIFA